MLATKEAHILKKNRVLSKFATKEANLLKMKLCLLSKRFFCKKGLKKAKKGPKSSKILLKMKNSVL